MKLLFAVTDCHCGSKIPPWWVGQNFIRHHWLPLLVEVLLVKLSLLLSLWFKLSSMVGEALVLVGPLGLRCCGGLIYVKLLRGE